MVEFGSPVTFSPGLSTMARGFTGTSRHPTNRSPPSRSVTGDDCGGSSTMYASRRVPCFRGSHTHTHTGERSSHSHTIRSTSLSKYPSDSDDIRCCGLPRQRSRPSCQPSPLSRSLQGLGKMATSHAPTHPGKQPPRSGPKDLRDPESPRVGRVWLLERLRGWLSPIGVLRS